LGRINGKSQYKDRLRIGKCLELTKIAASLRELNTLLIFQYSQLLPVDKPASKFLGSKNEK
jgi:hypothetical protein